MRLVSRCLLLACVLWALAGPGPALALRIFAEEGVDAADSGLDISGVVQAVLRELGERRSVEVVPWARGYMHLTKGPDVMLYPTTRTPEREDQFKWAGPIVSLQWAFYGLRGSGLRIDSLDDARKVGAIGTYFEDAREQFLKARGFTNIEPSRSNVLNMRKLYAGRVDLVVGTNVGLGPALEAAGVPREAVARLFAFKTAELYMAFSRDVPDAEVARWAAALESVRAGGELARICPACFPSRKAP